MLRSVHTVNNEPQKKYYVKKDVAWYHKSISIHGNLFEDCISIVISAMKLTLFKNSQSKSTKEQIGLVHLFYYIISYTIYASIYYMNVKFSEEHKGIHREKFT